MEEGTKERRGRRNNNNKINGSHKTTFDRAISTISISVLLFTRLFFCVSAHYYISWMKQRDRACPK